MSLVDDLRARMTELVSTHKVSIPPYPAIAMKLRTLVASGNYSFSDLVRVIKEDQVLAAAMMRAANSAMMRRTEDVTTVERAVANLGADEVCRISLAVSLGKVVGRPGPLTELRRAAWRQALAAAICTAHLAHRRHLNAETAFSCGLLHDFGRVIGVACLEEILRTDKVEDKLVFSDWDALLESFHVDIGALMAKRWNLAPILIEVIATHHDPAAATAHRDMAEVVKTCDGIVALMEQCPYLLPHDLTALGLLQSEADALMDALPFIPSYLMRLDEAMPEMGAALPSQVAHPASRLTGPRKDVAQEGAWVRSVGDLSCQLHVATADGLALSCRQPLPSGGVARIRMGTHEDALEVSGRVLSCIQQDDGSHLAELKLFVLPSQGKGAWDAFFATLPESEPQLAAATAG